MTNMETHKQYNLVKTQEVQSFTQGEFNSSGNILTTSKDLVIKNIHNFNDTELETKRGQKFGRTTINTLLTGSVYSASASDFLLGVTSLSYAPSIGLPKPSLVGAGKHFRIKDEVGGAATTTITVRSEGEKTIDGAATATITTNYGSKSFYSDGANWFSIS